MPYSKEILDFWEKVKKETGIREEFQDAFGFGDNPGLMDELLALVLTGKKIATTTLVKEMELEGSPEPKVGEYNIILDGSGKPRAIIRTVSVRHVRFCEVDEEHAYSEGEGDQTLESYRKEHIKYYGRRGEALGFTFSENMKAILERFEVVYPSRTST
ncbi:MAG: ASCH domain-containing protein [Candidatus Bathyarchaeia archaeon]